MKAKLFLLALCVLATFTACHEDEATVGGDIMPKADGLTASHAIYPIHTQTVEAGALMSATSRSYVGCMVDPETGIRTTASYLAQFHIEDQMTLPPLARMMTDGAGRVVADSCVLSINYDGYFGDSLNVMKLSVHELATERALSEAERYTTSIDPSLYLKTEGAQRKTVTYTALDQTKSASNLNNKKYYRQVAVRLDKDFGTKILRHYYTHPEHFKNSYTFARNVCAGFYVKHEGGVGTMLATPITALNIFYRQHTKGTTGNDTIVNTLLRLGSTEEVIQATRLDNEIAQELLADDKGYTYVKSPAGLRTQLTLPVADVVAGAHYNDTINSARFVLRAHTQTFPPQGTAPAQLLLLPLDQEQRFFQGTALPDGLYSYLATYQQGAYSFGNIAPLIAALRIARDKGAGVLPEDSPEVRSHKWKAWEQQHPNWNKMLLLPVVGDYSTVGTGSEARLTLQRLRHDFGLNSVRIEGGKKQAVELSVIYSKFRQ